MKFDIWFYHNFTYIPFLMQTSAFLVFPLAQWERRGWNSRKLSSPQTKPVGQVPESQSPSPTPQGKESQYSLSYLEQSPSDKQYWQFEVSQSESFVQVLSAAWIEKRLKNDVLDMKIQEHEL